MKIISVESAETINNWIRKNSLCAGIYRPEHIRLAVREQIRNEFLVSIGLTPPEPSHFKQQERNIIKFYDCCINCGALLSHPEGKNHFFHNNIEIFKLQFCCSCFNQFKDKSLEEFPARLIEKIQKKIKEFKT
ncbi:MAG: hypothetical protein ACFFKA_04075 [Candidatus Thorarchaeota archaeon]